MTKVKTAIQNCNAVVVSGGTDAMDIAQMYSDFSKLMHACFIDQYYEPPLDPRYYEPFVYESAFIKSQKDWVDCLVEMCRYIMYLEEYRTHTHTSFNQFRRDMKEHADTEQREEEEDDKEEDDTDGTWERFCGGGRHAQMKGMLCSLKNL